jgi:hypothetical protein
MGRFFSAIVDDGGKVYWKNGLSAHSEIEQELKIRDDGQHAKVELIPVDDFNNVDTWVFNIDEERKPDWWGGAFEWNVRQVVKDWMASGEKYAWIGGLDLSGVTKLDPGVVFPKEVSGGLNLRGVTKLDSGVVFPEKSGGLDLSGLTSLPKRGHHRVPERTRGRDQGVTPAISRR